MKTEEYVSAIKNMQAFCNLVEGFFSRPIQVRVYAAWHFGACGDGYVRLFAQGGFRAVLVYQR